MSPHRDTDLGIGADGWDGLTGTAQATVRAAEVIVGGARHLEYLPADVPARRVPLPSPLVPALRKTAFTGAVPGGKAGAGGRGVPERSRLRGALSVLRTSTGI